MSAETSKKSEHLSTSVLTKHETERYSRQLILPEIGASGQAELLAQTVLIVGAGGLGCPCAIYLASAGIGNIGIADYDVVEVDNLHRQVLHTEGGIGSSKSQSVANAVKALNSSIKCEPINELLCRENALKIISDYNIVVDCTDNVATRYLLNDSCVLLNKPLISGCALRFEGMLTVYHHNDGPCYRCIYPRPPPPDTVTNCSDGGVIGAVPGVIGTMQALEVIKLTISQLQVSLSGKLLIFDGKLGSFRTVKLRKKSSACDICGENPTIRCLMDYEKFCGAGPHDKCRNVKLLEENERISAKQLRDVLDNDVAALLIDVRPQVEFDICHLKAALNFPISQFSVKEEGKKLLDRLKDEQQIIVICRRGNDSQRAVRNLVENMEAQSAIPIRDVKGGYGSWQADVDPNFPLY